MRMRVFNLEGMTVEYTTVDEATAAEFGEFADALEKAIKPPEVPPPVWDQRPVSADACAAATRALCG